MRLILIVAFAVFGQQAKPDYNGTWVVNSDKSAKAIRDGLPATDRMTITVTEKDVTIVNQETGLVCGFGKVPIENDQVMPGALCSAKWDGDQLVTTMTRKSDPNRSKAPNSSNPTLKEYTPFTETRLSRAGTELKVTSAIYLASGNEVKRAPVVYDKAR